MRICDVEKCSPSADVQNRIAFSGTTVSPNDVPSALFDQKRKSWLLNTQAAGDVAELMVVPT